MSNTNLQDAINPVSATFVSPETEQIFRQTSLENEKTKVAQIALIAIPGIFIFMYSDFTFHNGGLLAAHVALRVSVAVLTVALFMFARKTKSGARLEAALVLWIVTGLTVIMFIDYCRPRESFSHLLIDLLYLACLYSVIPMRVTWKVAIGLFFTAGCLVVSLVYKASYTRTEILAILAALAVANLIGVYTTRRHDISKRTSFRMWNHEKTLREELQASVDEVKILRGLLRICANCKKIHTPEDKWEQIETYILKHSEATFTHGICPECSRKLYPGLMPE